MGIYRFLQGSTWQYAAGASGTVTIPAGSFILQIVAHSAAAGTVAIFGGTAIPVGSNGIALRFMHDLVVPGGTATVVFVGTDSYFVEYVTP
jgi:hypothetical protein